MSAVNKTLRIGAGKSNTEINSAKKMSEELSLQGIISTIRYYETGDFFVSANTILYNALLNNEIDTAPVELSTVALWTDREDILPTAISVRNYPAFILLISEKCFDPSGDLKIKKDSLVGVTSLLQGEQLIHLNPYIRLHYTDENTDAQINQLKNGVYNALVVCSEIIEKYQNEVTGYHSVKIHPTEMIHTPGYGVTAYLSHKDDLVTRKMLKTIHHSDTAKCTNIERKVLQLAGPDYADKIGVYCYTDQRNFFHAVAVRCDEFKKVNFSQSIATGMSEKIYDSLFNQIQH